MPRSEFLRELRTIQDDMILMANMVEQAITNSMDSLKNQNLVLAQKTIDEDALINEKRYAIENMCLLIIATQAPVASDLRITASILHIITDLERMGDHAAGIAKITIMNGEEALVKPLIDLPRMSTLALEMLHGSVDAFIAHDEEAARKISDMDDQVDDLYRQIYNELLLIMISDPQTITRATHLLWAAHNVERIADRATNICERVNFLVTGRIEELNIPHY